MSEQEKGLLAEALRAHPTFGHAYLHERARADELGGVVKDVWGSLLAYWTDMPEAEVQRLIARCESTNLSIDVAAADEVWMRGQVPHHTEATQQEGSGERI